MPGNRIIYHSSFDINGIHFTVVSSLSGIRKINLKLKGNDNLLEIHSVKPLDSRLHGVYFQMKDYFNRKRRAFDLPLEIDGTDFQKRVWKELLKIPYGETISYKELAIRLGNEKVIRAAASTIGANPIPIVIPCHRVIGADGSVVGYGGGIELKKKLLRLEGSRNMELFSTE